VMCRERRRTERRKGKGGKKSVPHRDQEGGEVGKEEAGGRTFGRGGEIGNKRKGEGTFSAASLMLKKGGGERQKKKGRRGSVPREETSAKTGTAFQRRKKGGEYSLSKNKKRSCAPREKLFSEKTTSACQKSIPTRGEPERGKMKFEQKNTKNLTVPKRSRKGKLVFRIEGVLRA